MAKKEVVIGRIGAPFGVKGWVHVHSFTEPPENLLSYANWCLDLNQKHTQRAVKQSRAHNDHFIVQLEGSDSPEEAMLLRNAWISVPREALPKLPKDEYYWADLVGLTVVTHIGQSLGQVESLMETGANDVLVVEGEGEQRLVPYTDETVLKIDIEKGTIVVHWEDE